MTDKGGQVEAGTLAPRVGYLMLSLPQTPRCNLLPSSRVYSGWFGLRWSPRRTTSLQSWSQDLLLRGRTGWGWGRTSQDRGEGSEGEIEGLGGEGEGHREGGLERGRKSIREERGKEKGDRGREEVRK